ncbi:MAG: FAD-dependent oxidoreductase [Pirellulaceae bacterium]
MSQSEPVVVIGGGIVGACCAWYLRQSGHEVTVIDAQKFGGACSHANCGYISPSHVLPLTVPGTIWKSLKSMASSNSPFYIRPRLSPGMWSWFLKFASRCNEKSMWEAAGSLHSLLQSSRALYEQLIVGEGLQCEWTTDGILFVYQSEHEFHEFEKTNGEINQRFGVAAKPYDHKSLVAMEPALKDNLGGAWHYECDAHVRPDLLMSELKRRLIQTGVTVLENASFQSFRTENGSAKAIQTSSGEIAGNRFVIATGAVTPLLNRELGVKVPIQPGKGYSITMPRPSICPRYPMIFEEHRVAITPMKTKYRIGSTMEFAGYDRSINQKRLKLLRNSAAIYLREPYSEPVEEEWYGWRPMTWDSKPIIDQLPDFKNVWMATGHNMLGISLGAVTGKLIAEMLNGEQPHLDLSPFRINRR